MHKEILSHHFKSPMRAQSYKVTYFGPVFAVIIGSSVYALKVILFL